MKKIVLLLTVLVLLLQAGCARIDESAPASDVLGDGETDELILESVAAQEKEAPVGEAEVLTEAEPEEEQPEEKQPESEEETVPSEEETAPVEEETASPFGEHDIRRFDLEKEKIAIVLAEITPKEGFELLLLQKYYACTVELWIKESYYGPLKERDKVQYVIPKYFYSQVMDYEPEKLIAMQEVTDPQTGETYYQPLRCGDILYDAWYKGDRGRVKEGAYLTYNDYLYNSIFECYVDQKEEPSADMQFLKKLEEYPEYHEKLRSKNFIVVRAKALDKGEPIVQNHISDLKYSESTRMHLEVQEVYYGPVQKGEIIDYWEYLGTYQDDDVIMTNLGAGEEPLEVGKEYLMVLSAHYAKEEGVHEHYFYREERMLSPYSYVSVSELPKITKRVKKGTATESDRFFYDLVN